MSELDLSSEERKRGSKTAHI